jgi:hypothetical protein
MLVLVTAFGHDASLHDASCGDGGSRTRVFLAYANIRITAIALPRPVLRGSAGGAMWGGVIDQRLQGPLPTCAGISLEGCQRPH